MTALNVIYGLYCTCSDCGEDSPIKYVGQSSKGVVQRYYHHTYCARQGKPWAVARWMRKHGPENIKYRVLEELENRDQLDEAEVRWIEHYGTLIVNGDGYNIVPGGKSVRGYTHRPDARTRQPKIHSAETIEKIKAARKNQVGSLTPRATIDEAQAADIKRRLWNGRTIKQVMSELSLPEGVVLGISSGASWQHVPWPIGPRNRISSGRFDSERNKGENSHSAIFTEADIREIRALRETGLSYAELGRRYGTSGTNISYICKRITWGHVD